MTRKDSTDGTAPTLASLIEAMEQVKNYNPTPYVELHGPSCPKVKTQGKQPCMCSSCPAEAAFALGLAQAIVDGDKPGHLLDREWIDLAIKRGFVKPAPGGGGE